MASHDGRSLGPGVTGSYKPSSVDAGHRTRITWVSCRSHTCSELWRQLSRPVILCPVETGSHAAEGGPKTHSATDDGLEILMALVSSPKCWG